LHDPQRRAGHGVDPLPRACLAPAPAQYGTHDQLTCGLLVVVGAEAAGRQMITL
jgi:hypothetical protein